MKLISTASIFYYYCFVFTFLCASSVLIYVMTAFQERRLPTDWQEYVSISLQIYYTFFGIMALNWKKYAIYAIGVMATIVFTAKLLMGETLLFSSIALLIAAVLILLAVKNWKEFE